MTSSPRGARRRRPVLVPVALAVIAAGIGVTAAFGGLEEAPDEPPPKAQPGEVIDQGEFQTQFIKAVDTVERNEFGRTKRYLKLVLKVTNMGDTTASIGILPAPGTEKAMRVSGFAASLLRVSPEIKSENDPTVSVLSYGIESSQLHPGITTTVVVSYALAPTAVAPEKITVDVGGFVYEMISNRDQTHYWQIAPKGELPTDAGSEAEPIVPAVLTQVTLPIRKEEA